MSFTLFTFSTVAAGLIALAVAGSRHLRRSTEDGDSPYDPSPGERYPHLWGYQDTRFEFCGPNTVRVTGNRYPLAGTPLPYFIPFVESVLGVPMTPDRLREPASLPEPPPARTNDGFMTAVRELFSAGQINDGAEERLIHSHGQLSVEEIYRIIGGALPDRIVDLVVYPAKENEIVDLVALANRHDVVLIPYGGGTNVSGALLCPQSENRMIVSVDMRRMNRILEVDRENNCVTVEAGITGKDLELCLAEAGLTSGHIPDSIEFSTLGGWVATNASGMKKNRYGNIENIVLEAVLVTPQGELRSMPVNPRSSTGIQPRSFLFGCEGNLGIITRAVLQVWPLPESRKYASFVFPDFSSGVRFLKEVQGSGARPASIRLTNNTEFRLGQAMSPHRSGWKGKLNRLKKSYIVRVKGFDLETMVACTAVMEGKVSEVRQQERTLAQLASESGGLSGGAEGGKRGYRVTFAIAYIRDFLNRLGVLGETFETSAPWGRIESITNAVEKELHSLCARHGVRGKPFLSYRISQSYQAGVCIYFTMGFVADGLDDPERTYQKIEHKLREVILEHGGSLSHHHGVGKIRSEFISRVHSESSLQALRAVKKSLDPRNVFAAGNNIFDAAGAEKPSVTTAGITHAGEERS